MALTEEQREIALRAVDLVLSNLADRRFDVHVCDEDVVEDIRRSLAIDIATIYTEAPIAPPASEQKQDRSDRFDCVMSTLRYVFGARQVPHASIEDHFTAIIDAIAGWDFTNSTDVKNRRKAIDRLIGSPQPDYKAQRDALLEAVIDAVDRIVLNSEEYDFEYGMGRGAPQIFWDELDAAIASVKGGSSIATCHHAKDTTIHSGDGTPVSYCTDCGRNEVQR